MSGRYGEPWVAEHNGSPWSPIWDSGHFPIAESVQPRNARVLVARVNALVGVTIEGDETGAVRELVGAARELTETRAGTANYTSTLDRLRAALSRFGLEDE